MPFSFDIDVEQNAVFFKSSNVFTAQDLFESVKQVVSHPAYRPGFDHLVDLTEVTSEDVGEIELRIKANADRRMTERLGNGKCAFVASNRHVLAMTGKYKELMSNGPMKIENFMDVHEAKAWLGLDE